MCVLAWWLHPTRLGRLRARNAALRKALAEAQVQSRVWQMSAERQDESPPSPDTR